MPSRIPPLLWYLARLSCQMDLFSLLTLSQAAPVRAPLPMLGCGLCCTCFQTLYKRCTGYFLLQSAFLTQYYVCKFILINVYYFSSSICTLCGLHYMNLHHWWTFVCKFCYEFFILVPWCTHRQVFLGHLHRDRVMACQGVGIITFPT